MGVFRLHLPDSLLRNAEHYAAQEGIPVDQLITLALAEKLAALKTADYFTERAQRGNVQAAMALLNRAGGHPPTDDDRQAFEAAMAQVPPGEPEPHDRKCPPASPHSEAHPDPGSSQL